MKKDTFKMNQFFEKMLACLPDTIQKYEESIAYYGERLDTVVVEDVFMPVFTEIIRIDNNTSLLQSIFEYFEEVSNCEDEYLLNVFSVTVLEILGNEEEILLKSEKYMGPKTRILQLKADLSLGRVR